MKIRQSATAAALLLAGMLVLTGCAPAWLLPPVPDRPPVTAPIATPDAGNGTTPTDTGTGSETGSGDEGDGSEDPNELYSWVSLAEDSMWTVSVDVDMNAIAMNISSEGITMLTGEAVVNGTSMVLTLTPDELFNTGDALNNNFVLTLADVEANSTSMKVSINGADQGEITMSLSNSP